MSQPDQETFRSTGLTQQADKLLPFVYLESRDRNSITYTLMLQYMVLRTIGANPNLTDNQIVGLFDNVYNAPEPLVRTVLTLLRSLTLPDSMEKVLYVASNVVPSADGGKRRVNHYTLSRRLDLDNLTQEYSLKTSVDLRCFEPPEYNYRDKKTKAARQPAE